MTPPRILIVGAGAVGQSYALALKRAGCAVHFFVRPHHVDGLLAGIPIEEVGLLGTGPRVDLSSAPLHTDWSEVAAQPWHSIWLATSSTALRGDWLADLAAARKDATVVSFQTGTSGRTHLGQHIPADALVSAMIPFLAWWAPLDGHAPPPDGPCMRVWHPPGMKTPLSGPLGRVDDIVGLLRSGGLAARKVPAAAVQGALGSAILLPTIAGLETAHWDLKHLTKGPSIRRVVAAIHEARALVGRLHNVPVAPTPLLRPWLFWLAARLAPRVVPLPLETYLRVHFTKVGDQTAASLHDLVAAGDRYGVPTPALAELQHALKAIRSSP